MSKQSKQAKRVEQQQAICITCKQTVLVSGPIWGATKCAECQAREHK